MKCVCVKKPEVEADQQDSLIEAGANRVKRCRERYSGGTFQPWELST